MSTRIERFGKIEERFGTKLTEAVIEAQRLTQEWGHAVIDLPHVILAFLRTKECDALRAIEDQGISTGDLEHEMIKHLRKIQGRAASAPQLGHLTEDLLVATWPTANLVFEAPIISTGHALFTLLDGSETEYQRWSANSRLLSRIKLDDLRSFLSRLTDGEVRPEEIAQAAPVAGAQGAGGAGDAQDGPGPSSGALDKFAHDFTAAAREGKLDPVVGRETEIRSLIDIVVRRRKNNPMLLGEAGVGKTAVVEGFAQLIASGEVPEPLKRVRLLGLDLGSLQAGASLQGEFEQRLKSLVQEVQESPDPVILFIDEVHNLIGAGGAAGTGDAANLIKPELARGTLRTIAATTLSEYKQHIEKDPALERRFQPVYVHEPTTDVATEMMRTLVPSLEKHHGVFIRDEAVKAAVELTGRYVHGRQLPDKSVDVLDTAAARVGAASGQRPASLVSLETRQSRLLDEQKALTREAGVIDPDAGERLLEIKEELESIASDLESQKSRFDEESTAIAGLLEARAAMFENSEDADARSRYEEALNGVRALQGEEGLVPFEVDRSAIASVIGSWTGIPVGKMMKDEIASSLGIRGALSARVFGQDAGIDLLAERLMVSKADLNEEDRPIGVFLLAGPSGVGKTETALAVADLLFGSEEQIITINMSEYQEGHSGAALKGPPPGYVGYGKGGVLTEAVRHRPYSVVLLDEFEKAHRDVHEMFYQVFDKGIMDDSEGRRVSFRNTVILLTSNVGGDHILEACLQAEDEGNDPPSQEDLISVLTPHLKRAFASALIGRMTLVPFRGLARKALASIVRSKLRKVERRLDAMHQLSFSVADSVIEAIVGRCSTPHTGARAIDNIIRAELLPEMSKLVLQRMLHPEQYEGLSNVIVEMDPIDPENFSFRITKKGTRAAETPPPAAEEAAAEDAPENDEAADDVEASGDGED